ncbi:CENP-Q, a CENPA-CAD centromere complex subunit-domain-containing protein [Diplogelasinospora grovesii]|uniref:CENP-Q, a CENPA-CAD centromere complex subunit-domain-containing protein n=1 Tax=Diplogelasinospora grovesii TaxID=303347 RepID=A0AAN6NIH5_9PEZI|nr:CENP-Q, a CENPA-CAD centromere complex subunit-domain-containing protein [Diplogelasinospora grovesii]
MSERQNQKRKRGRPPGASENADGASAQKSKADLKAKPQPTTQDNSADAHTDADARPRKRGRPGKSQENVPKEQRISKAEGAPDEARDSRPGKRGRPRKSDGVAAESEENPAPSRPRKRRKQSPSGGETAEQQPEEPKNGTTVGTKTRGKKSHKAAAEAGANVDAPPVQRAHRATDSPLRRSTRDRHSAEGQQWWAARTNQLSSPTAARPSGKDVQSSSRGVKRGRSSLGDVPVSEAQNKSSPRNKGQQQQQQHQRRKKTKASPGRQSASPQAESSRSTTRAGKPSKKAPPDQAESAGAKGPRKRPSRSSGNLAEADGSTARPSPRAAEGSNREKPNNKSGARKRRSTNASNQADGERPDAAEEAEPAAAGPRPSFRFLASRTRQIPRSVISAKWTALDPPSIAAVDSIISDAYNPILSRLRDRDNRHKQAQTILHRFASRLHSKLVKGMPFPPPSTKPSGAKGAGSGSHEVEFDFERTVDAIQALEATLDPLLHSVALLNSEKDKEEAALEKDYELLRTLETNARAEARSWRERGKRDHVLAPEIRPPDEREPDTGLELVRTTDGRPPGSVFNKDLQGDEELLSISRQIGSHMESIKGNLQQIEGVLPAIAKSKAALQHVLYKHLEPQQYDQVLLG